MTSTCECCSLVLFSLCVSSWLCPKNHCAMHKPYNNVFVVVIYILSMLFVYINVYWCLTRFPFQTMLMSFNNNATGATSRAGTVYPSRAPYFTPELCWVHVRKFVCLCVVFCPPLLFFLYFFFWPLQCLSFSFGPCNVCLFLLPLAMSVFFLELQFLITPWYLQSPSDIFWCYWNIAMLMKVKFTIRKVKSSPFSDRFIFNRPVL